MQVRGGRGVRAPRVDDDHARALAPGAPGSGPSTIGWQAAVFDPISRKQLAASMSAYDGGGPSAPNVRVVTGDRRRHAQARVGVDVVGAEEALRQLVDDVVVLGQKLARTGRTRSTPDRARAGSRSGDRASRGIIVLPGRLVEARVQVVAPQRGRRPVRAVRRVGERERLRAGAAAVDRVRLVAATPRAAARLRPRPRGHNRRRSTGSRCAPHGARCPAASLTTSPLRKSFRRAIGRQGDSRSGTGRLGRPGREALVAASETRTFADIRTDGIGTSRI